MAAAEHGDQEAFAQEADDAELKYAKWRSGLQTWEERAAQRATTVKACEDHFKRLLQQREEERQRQELEKRRREEAAARAEQRRKEAAEYSAWRADAVIARRAEERTRAAEHTAWRNHLKKLGRGVVVSGAPDTSASAAKQSCSGVFTARSPSHGDSIHRGRPSAWAEDAIYASAPPSWALAGEDHQRLAEDDAWKMLVERNKEAIRAERAQREAEAVKRREYMRRQQILAKVGV
mmetsp:Transcript_109288/g.193502  ORF Transcript_109288/g.193502 Transcript_109288/m.193502 type:complete len:235 (+) Transcript_109288:78-782(+)